MTRTQELAALYKQGVKVQSGPTRPRDNLQLTKQYQKLQNELEQQQIQSIQRGQQRAVPVAIAAAAHVPSHSPSRAAVSRVKRSTDGAVTNAIFQHIDSLGSSIGQLSLKLDHALQQNMLNAQQAIEGVASPRKSSQQPPTPMKPHPPTPLVPRHTAHSTSVDAVANAALQEELTRIGEINRKKFYTLLLKIKELHENQQQQRDAMSKMLQEQDELRKAATESRNNSNQVVSNPLSSLHTLSEIQREKDELEARYYRQREEFTHLMQQNEGSQAQMSELQRQLETVLHEKNSLQQQLEQVRSTQDSSKYALMEKMTDITNIYHDLQLKHKHDRALLRAYEDDLKQNRSTIEHLNDMLRKETLTAAEHKELTQQLQEQLRDMETYLHRKQQQEQQAHSHERHHHHHVHQPTESSAKKFKSFVNKYMAVFYRNQYQSLLEAHMANLNQSRPVLNVDGTVQASRASTVLPEELSLLQEKHQLQLDYERKTHQQVTAVYKQQLNGTDKKQEELKHDVEMLAEHAERLEKENAEKEKALKQQAEQNEALRAQLKTDRQHVQQEEFNAFMLESFKGDYLQLRDDHKACKIIYELGDNDIVFSDHVTRIDHRNKHQKRTLLITDKSIYCLWPDKARTVRRRLLITDLLYVSISRQSADMFVLHAKDSYDYLLLSPKRSEIMYHLLKLYVSLTGTHLNRRFSERIFVSDREKTQREVIVTETQTLKLGPSNIVVPLDQTDRQHGQAARAVDVIGAAPPHQQQPAGRKIPIDPVGIRLE